MICFLEMIFFGIVLNYGYMVRLIILLLFRNSLIFGSLVFLLFYLEVFCILNVYVYYVVSKRNYSFFFKEVYDRR